METRLSDSTSGEGARPASPYSFRKSSGSLVMSAALRRASSLVSNGRGFERLVIFGILQCADDCFGREPHGGRRCSGNAVCLLP